MYWYKMLTTNNLFSKELEIEQRLKRNFFETKPIVGCVLCFTITDLFVETVDFTQC